MPIIGFEQAGPVNPPAHDVDERLQFQLVRPDGGGSLLLDQQYSVQLGVQNLDGAPLNLMTSRSAGWDGDRVDDIGVEPIELSLPLLVEGGTLEGLRDAKQVLRDFTNPRRGPVILRVTRPNGIYRDISGLRSGPVGGSLDDGAWGVNYQKFPLVLHCSDPLWQEPLNPWRVTWSIRADTGAPLPILPVAPSASQALSDTNDVTVYGDAETFPVWRITGPLEAVTVRDEGRDLEWTLTASLAPAETWTVDTRRGMQGVFDADGHRSRAHLSANAYLWGLQPGVSRISTDVAGGAAGASVVGEAPSRWESY